MALRLRSLVTVARAARGATAPGSASWGERLSALPRLVRQTWDGSYQGLGRGRLLMMLAAALYVVAPVDLVPEAMFGPFGLADDTMVIAWLASALATETQSYLQWQRGPQDTVRSTVR